MLFPLAFYIGFYYLNRCTACRKQAKALAPELFFPQLLPYLRKVFLYQAAACAFISIYEFTDFRLRMRFEQNMYMVFIAVPFLQGNVVVWRNMLKDFFCTVGNTIIKYLSSVFYDKNKMIIQQEYRMCIVV